MTSFWRLFFSERCKNMVILKSFLKWLIPDYIPKECLVTDFIKIDFEEGSIASHFKQYSLKIMFTISNSFKNTGYSYSCIKFAKVFFNLYNKNIVKTKISTFNFSLFIPRLRSIILKFIDLYRFVSFCIFDYKIRNY